MKKLFACFFTLVLLFPAFACSEAGAEVPEIILEDGYFYAVQPDGKKVVIVKEHEPWAMNKAKPSPDGKGILYTTSNGLGFECEGRDLFCCKTDGTERTFLHKFPAYVEEWFWLTESDRSFLILLNRGSMSGPAVWVLDFDNRKLLMSFPGDSVERIADSQCYKILGIGKEKSVCPDDLIRMAEGESPPSEVHLDWASTGFFLLNERDPILGAREVATAFAMAHQNLAPEERQLYQKTLHTLASGSVLLGGPFPVGHPGSFGFSVDGMSGTFNLQRKKIESLDIGGPLSLGAFWSPQGRYFALLKTELDAGKKLSVWSTTGDGVRGNALVKEFPPEASILKVEWSRDDEAKIHYSLKEGPAPRDSCLIDLTQTRNK